LSAAPDAGAMTDEPEIASPDAPAGPNPFPLREADPAYAGQAAYTPRMLRAYDAMVVKLSNSYVWHCPADRILEHYDRHVAASHLDVGPGTGYYLDHCRFPDDRPLITLLDPNPEVLRFAADRLRRYEPTLLRVDALRPFGLAETAYGSIGLGYVLHCLPGGMAGKAVVFDHLAPLVARGGVLFGTTILHDGVLHTRVGRTLLRIYNRKRIFANVGDDRAGLERELARRFDRYEVEVVGAVALFAAWP
jgi:SAM-dependent methyltransferase